MFRWRKKSHGNGATSSSLSSSPTTPSSAATHQYFSSPVASNQQASVAVSESDATSLSDDPEFDSSFEGVLDSDTWRALFRQYLLSTHNGEPLEFMEQVELYHTKKSPKNRYHAAKEIVNAFLREKSPKEINISKQHRTTVITQFEQCSEDHCPKTLFDEVSGAIVLELKEDCFPKFLSSAFVAKYIAKQEEQQAKKLNSQQTGTDSTSATLPNHHQQILNNNNKNNNDNSMSDVTSCDELSDTSNALPDKEVEVTDKMFFSGMDRKSYNITKEEFEYVLREATDNDHTEWVKLTRKSKFEGRAIYLSKNSFMFNDVSSSGQSKKRYIHKMKEEGYFPYSVDELFYAISDIDFAHAIEDEWMNGKHHTFVPASDTNQFASTVFIAQYKCPFPIKNREFLIGAAAVRHGDHIIFARKSMNSPDMPKASKGFIRAECVGGIVLEKIYKDKTKYTNTTLIDFGGQIPIRLWNYGLSKRDDRFHANVIRAVEQRRKLHAKNGILDAPPPENSFGLVDTLKANERIVQEQNITFSC